MLELFSKHAVTIFSAATPFIIWAMNAFLQPRARLFQQSRHQFVYLIQEPLLDPEGKIISPTQTVHTTSVSIFNAGRSTATKVEVVFNWKPQFINIWPSRHFEEKLSPDGRYHMFFDALPSKDTVGFEILSINRDLPPIVTVRSEQCVAKTMELQPQPVAPRWKWVLVLALLAVGSATMAYFILSLLRLLLVSP